MDYILWFPSQFKISQDGAGTGVPQRAKEWTQCFSSLSEYWMCRAFAVYFVRLKAMSWFASPLVLLSFLKATLGKEGIYLAYRFSPSQGKSGQDLEAGTDVWGGMLASYWLGFLWGAQSLSYTTQAHLPRDVSTHSEQDHLSTIKKRPRRSGHRPV